MTTNTAKPQDIIVDEKLLARTTEVFSLFDKDEDGAIRVTEIGPILRSIGFNPSEVQIRQLMQEYDDSDGFVDFTNFLVLVSKFKREGDSEEEILEAFRVFDPQFTGVISVTEFRQVMMNYGERLTEQEVDNLVALADVDRKGEIRYMENTGLEAAIEIKSENQSLKRSFLNLPEVLKKLDRS